MFGSIWNRSSKNYKIPKKKENIQNTQNRKLGNLGKFYLLKFLAIYETQNQKNDLQEKTLTLWYGFRR